MNYLDREQQVFIRQQITDWAFGRQGAFDAMNRVWFARAEAYFWN